MKRYFSLSRLIMLCLLALISAPQLASAQSNNYGPALTPATQGVSQPDRLPADLYFQSPSPDNAAESTGLSTTTNEEPILSFADISAATSGVISSADATGDENWAAHFSVPGVPFNELSRLAVGADGTIYACCTMPNYAQYEVLAWNGNTWIQLDSRFDRPPTALVTLGNTLYAVGPFTNASGTSAKGIAKWDGAKWARVGSGAGPQQDRFGTLEEGTVHTAAIYQGDLVIAGAFDLFDGVPASNIARWNGTNWRALGDGIGFQEGFNSEQGVYALTVDGNTLYAGGEFISAGEEEAANIAAWNGAHWSSLGSGIDIGDQYDRTRVLALAAAGGKVYAGGLFGGAGGKTASHVAMWNGSAWSALGEGIGGPNMREVYTLLLDGTTLYVGGKFAYAGGNTIPNLARFANNTWSALPNGLLDEFNKVNALAARPGGGFYIAGDFDRIGGLLAHNIAEYTGTQWDVFGRGLTTTETNASVGKIYALVEDENGNIYAGGWFATAGGVTVNNVALWDGTRWHALSEGVQTGGNLAEGAVRALAFYKGELYAGGQFTTAGGATAKHLAKWNPATRQWAEVGGGIDGQVNALVVGHDRLYVGGNFKTTGTLSVNDVAYWNGTTWGAPSSDIRIYQIFDTCAEQGTHVYALAVWNNILVIAGDFRLVYAGGDLCSISSYRAANHIMLWDAQDDTWYLAGAAPPYGVSGITEAFATPINTLAVAGNEVYVGGGFGNAGSISVSKLAKFSGEGWANVGGGVSGSGNDCFTCGGPNVAGLLASGARLYVTGDFINTGGGPAHNIAVYDIVKQSWSAFGSGLNSVGHVRGRALAIGKDGLFVGGEFEQVGSKAATGFTRWASVAKAKTIGNTGGTLESDDGVKITFPAGAVNEEVNIQYAPLADQGLNPPAKTVAIRGFRFTATNGQGAPITQFAKEYTLVVDYPTGWIGDPTKLNIHTRTANGWQPLLPCAGCQINPSTGKITLVAGHFTDFIVTVEVDETTEPEPNPGTNKVFIPITQQ